MVQYTQSRNLSCEYAATYAATTAFGAGVPEQVFIDSIPLASNPHYGYRGNIDGWWGNTTDYGIYAEALVPTLNANGFNGDVMYTGGDVAPLVSHLDAGHPVVVWLGFWGDTREVLNDQDTYSVFAGMHVVTVTGYNDAGVFVTVNSDDPPMFGTTLTREYEIAADLLGLDAAGVAQLATNAVRASFLPDDDKAALAGEISAYLADWQKR